MSGSRPASPVFQYCGVSGIGGVTSGGVHDGIRYDDIADAIYNASIDISRVPSTTYATRSNFCNLLNLMFRAVQRVTQISSHARPRFSIPATTATRKMSHLFEPDTPDEVKNAKV